MRRCGACNYEATRYVFIFNKRTGKMDTYYRCSRHADNPKPGGAVFDPEEVEDEKMVPEGVGGAKKPVRVRRPRANRVGGRAAGCVQGRKKARKGGQSG